MILQQDMVQQFAGSAVVSVCQLTQVTLCHGDDKANRDAGPFRLEKNLSSDTVCDGTYGCMYAYTHVSKDADVFLKLK